MATQAKQVEALASLPQVPGYPDYCYDEDWNIYRRSGPAGTRVGCRLSSHITSQNRVAWGLRRDGRLHTFFRAELVCSHAHGPRPTGMLALHNNGNSMDDSPDNLRWGTQKENMADRRAHGTYTALRGEQHSRAKLTERDVIAIRSSAATNRELADRYSVTISTIEHVRKRIIWKDVA